MFSKKENYNEFKKLINSWVTKGMAKSSKKTKTLRKTSQKTHRQQ